MTKLSEKEAPHFLRDLLANENNAREEVLACKVDLSELSIPNPRSASTAYREVPVSENLIEDSLVELNQYGFNAKPDYYAEESASNPVYGHVFNDATPQVMLNRALVEKLAEMNDFLRKHYGIEFEPMNGFRPLAVQKAIFTDFYNAGLEKYKEDYSEEALHKKATEHALTYASLPPEVVTLNDSQTWYAHGTGAAIDLLLRQQDGARLEFGVIFDCPEAITATRAFEGMPYNNETVRANRRKLFWSMATAGFVNYPEEFFHFDPYQIDGRLTQFAIINAESWGLSGSAALRATVPVAKEAITE